MHEMGLAEGIVEVVHGIAGNRPVEAVRVRVGAQQAVAPDSLEFNFRLLVEGTWLQGAKLEITPASGDDVRIDEIEVGGDRAEVIRRPDLAVSEAPHDQHDAHTHPAWQ